MALIPLRRALPVLAAAGFAFGLIVAVVIATGRHLDLRGLEATLALIIGWGFIGAGLYAWWRRPHNNFGPLMTATGFLFFVSELAASNSPFVFTVAGLCGNLFLAVVVHMLLAMPSGRLRSRAERALVVSTYVFSAPPSRSYLLFADQQEHGCGACPDNLVLIRDDADLAHLIDTVVNGVAFLIFALLAVLLWRHWQHSNRAERRALGPVLVTGGTMVALVELGLVGELSGHATVAEYGYYATQVAILRCPTRSWPRSRAAA